MRRQTQAHAAWLLLLVSSLVVSAQQQATDQKAELVIQKGHVVPVRSVSFSPDGKILASADMDRTIKLWDIATGRELWTLGGHSQQGITMVFSPDSKTLISADWRDRTIVWDVLKGTERLRLEGAHAPLVFSRDGRTFITGSGETQLKLWDTINGKELRTFTGHSAKVTSAAFTDDGKTLVSASRDSSVILWDFITARKLRHERIEEQSSVSPSNYTIVVSPNGQFAATIDQKSINIQLRELGTGARRRVLAGHADRIESVSFSADSKLLITGSWDHTIRVWDTLAGTTLHRLEINEAPIISLAMSPDNQTITAGTINSVIKLWDVVTGKIVENFTGNAEQLNYTALSPDLRIIAGGTGRNIRLWDLGAGGEQLILHGDSLVGHTAAFSPDSRTFAQATEGRGAIELWDAVRGVRLWIVRADSWEVTSLAFSRDGKLLVSGGRDSSVALWDATTAKKLKKFTGHSDQVFAVALSPDSRTIASGGKDSAIKLWDTTSGKLLRNLQVDPGVWVESLSFSPDGKSLTAAVGEFVYAWDVASGRRVRGFAGHLDRVNAVTFSPDGKTLASVSEDRTVKLWDFAKGSEISTLVGHSNPVKSVAYSSDGRILVTDGEDPAVKFWDAFTGRELGSLATLGEKDWAVFNPIGLFDASHSARELIHYIVGTEVVTLDQTKDLYYVPGLLKKVIKGETLPDVELFSASDLFPEAQYEQLKPGQKTFTVMLRNRGGGIGAVEVFVNGTQVISDARPTRTDPKAKQLTLTIDLSDIKQIVPGKENRVEVIARNTAGSLSSKSSAKGTEFVFIDEGMAPTTPPNLYAIVGGVADYVDERLRLQYSAKDAEDFARALEIGASKFLGPDKVHIRLLTSNDQKIGKLFTGPDSSVLSPTKEAFRKVFTEFAANAKPNDLLVVYLSGHGVALKLNQNSSKLGGDTYLYLTREAYTTAPAALADEKIRSATSVSGDELLQWIKDIAASSKALVLDTCAAGAAAESLIVRRTDPEEAVRVRAIEHLKDTTGFFILMGSAGDKVSYEATPYRQGLLTYSLLEALKGAKLHDGGYANVGQLFDYAQGRVPLIARNLGLYQQPRFLAPDVGSPFDVGLYTESEQKLFDLPTPSPLILRPSLQNKDLGYDNLKLLPLLNRALLEASNVGSRGGDQRSLVFVDASEMFDAFLPSGSYTITGNQATINLNLIRNEQLAATLAIEGPVTDEQSKASLVQRLVAAISAQTQKLIIARRKETP